MSKLIIIHYDNLADDATPAPHVILARRGSNGTFEQVGHVGGGEVSALRLIGVAAVSRPHVELFGSDAFEPPHFFPAHDFFAAPANFIGYYPQFLGLGDIPEAEDWVEALVSEQFGEYGIDDDSDHGDYSDAAVRAVEKAVETVGASMFGYGLPILAVTVQTIEDLPRGGEPGPIIETRKD